MGCINSVYTVLSFLGVYTVLFMEGKEEGPGSEAILLTFFTMMHQLNGLKLPHPDEVTFVTNYVYLTCDMIATNLFGKVHGGSHFPTRLMVIGTLVTITGCSLAPTTRVPAPFVPPRLPAPGGLYRTTPPWTLARSTPTHLA